MRPTKRPSKHVKRASKLVQSAPTRGKRRTKLSTSLLPARLQELKASYTSRKASYTSSLRDYVRLFSWQVIGRLFSCYAVRSLYMLTRSLCMRSQVSLRAGFVASLVTCLRTSLYLLFVCRPPYMLCQVSLTALLDLFTCVTRSHYVRNQAS